MPRAQRALRRGRHRAPLGIGSDPADAAARVRPHACCPVRRTRQRERPVRPAEVAARQRSVHGGTRVVPVGHGRPRQDLPDGSVRSQPAAPPFHGRSPREPARTGRAAEPAGRGRRRHRRALSGAVPGRVPGQRHRRRDDPGQPARGPVRARREPGHHLQHRAGQPLPGRPAARPCPARDRPDRRHRRRIRRTR